MWVTILEVCYQNPKQYQWLPRQQRWAKGIYRALQVLIPHGPPGFHWIPWHQCLYQEPALETPDQPRQSPWRVSPEYSGTGLTVTCAWSTWIGD
jgi:hypothetical protein